MELMGMDFFKLMTIHFCNNGYESISVGVKRWKLPVKRAREIMLEKIVSDYGCACWKRTR